MEFSLRRVAILPVALSLLVGGLSYSAEPNKEGAKAGKFLFRRRCNVVRFSAKKEIKQSELDGRFPRDWNLAEIKTAAYPFGESKVLAWSIREDNRPLRVESCLVGNIAGEEKDEWRIIVIYRHPLSDDKKWHLAMLHATYPKGHKFFPGLWHFGMELFDTQPSNKDVVSFLNRPTISWTFATEEKWHLLDSHISTDNWKWFTGELPSSKFR